MSRPAGVTVSAVFLILGSAFLALMGVFMLLARSFVPPNTPEPPFAKAMMIFMDIVFFGTALWGVLTAVGLFRMRRWARLSILVIGALLVIFCGLSLVMLLVVTRLVPEFESARGMSMVVGVMSTIYLIPIAFGIWWLIYFNRAAVKAAFLQGYVPAEGPRRPLSIAVIAWHLVAFGLLTPMSMLWMQLPAIFLGMVLTGWAAALVYWIYAILEISIGVGLLRLKPWSQTAAVWFLVFGMVNGVASAFVPDINVKLLAAMQAFMPAGANVPAVPAPWLNAIFAVLLMGIPVWYLVTRKQAFLEAGRNLTQANDPIA